METYEETKVETLIIQEQCSMGFFSNVCMLLSIDKLEEHVRCHFDLLKSFDLLLYIVVMCFQFQVRIIMKELITLSLLLVSEMVIGF